MCACFVDNMFKFPMGRYRGMKMSHLIADSEAELHEMARKIGVSRRHYQGNHYDIAMSKRKLAIKYGAVEITLRELSRISRGQEKRHRRTRSTTASEGLSQPLESVKPTPEVTASIPRKRLPEALRSVED